MIKKFHIALISLTLGFFLNPMFAYACGTKVIKTEKACCKKATTQKSNKKECCKNHKSTNKNNGCKGKCGNSNCNTPTASFVFVFPFQAEAILKPYFYNSKKIKNYYLQNHLSDGFSFVFIPPNIS